MIIGTAIKIITTLSSSADSVSITIYDPDEIKKVDSASMTSIGSNRYQYIFQTLTNYTVGRYKAIISAVSGQYTSRSKTEFNLGENP